MRHSCWVLSAPASLLCAKCQSKFFNISVAPFPQLRNEDAVFSGGCLLWDEHFAVLPEFPCGLLPIQAVPITAVPQAGAGCRVGVLCALLESCVPGETALKLLVFIKTGRIIQSRNVCLAQHVCLIRIHMSVFGCVGCFLHRAALARRVLLMDWHI